MLKDASKAANVDDDSDSDSTDSNNQTQSSDGDYDNDDVYVVVEECCQLFEKYHWHESLISWFMYQKCCLGIM